MELDLHHSRLGERLYGMPYLLLVITTLSWAGNTVLARGVVEVLPPLTLAFWRWLTALLLLLPFAWPFLKRDWPVVRASLPILALISLAGVSCYNTFLYIGVQTTTAINSGLILATGPAAIVLMSRLVLGQRISPAQAAGLLLSFAGVALVIAQGSASALARLAFVRGDLWVVGSVLASAVFSVFLRFRPKLHPASLVFCTFVLGLLFLLPFYAWERAIYPPVDFTPGVISSILYVAVAPSIIAFFCWNRGIELIGPNRAGLFLYLTPVFVAALAWLFLGEALYWYHFAGMLLIFGGMILFNRRALRRGQ